MSNFTYYNQLTFNWLLNNGIRLAKNKGQDVDKLTYDELNQLYIDSLPQYQKDLFDQLETQMTTWISNNNIDKVDYSYSSFSLGNANISINQPGDYSMRLINALPLSITELLKMLGWFKAYQSGYYHGKY